MQPPVIVGATFREATVDLREALAFPRADDPSRVRGFLHPAEVAETLVISTCNRVEVYAVPAPGASDDDTARAVRRIWAQLLGVDPEFVERRTRVWSGREALHHALLVMASLDSLVVGEAQILGQSKSAYRVASEVGAVGPDLRTLFELGFRVAKRVRTETAIGRESVSISSVAVSLAREIFDPMSTVRVLLVGAGKMAELAGRSLEEAGARSVSVVNRTFERAERVAGKRGWRAHRFDELDVLLPEVDVVITSTGSARPVIRRQIVAEAMRKRRYRPLFFIDIAVPRDVAPDVTDVDRAYVYNIDDLEQIANQNLRARRHDVEEAEHIVLHGLESLHRMDRLARRKPLLSRVAGHAERIRDEELRRAMNRLGITEGDPRYKALFQMAHHITQRLTRGAYRVIKEHEGEDLRELSRLLEAAYGIDTETPDGPVRLGEEA